MEINKQTIKYLAELGRIKLKEKNEDKLLKDIQAIFNYFKELKEADTEGVEPLVGGTIQKNIFREDEITGLKMDSREKLIMAFPDEKDGYLKVPPVFE
ncbi:Asp-tRNA(Asn)/Glu-tRNA(Gln) amidotransferase subunit GatC [Candidatus Wolfebacteria bacterium]|nr:Asp-tRNA(Asn)/Glu-tRNA(Gln) amidotransferase subunit GatC [Candidatus Wolfebacteria bacterium]